MPNRKIKRKVLIQEKFIPTKAIDFFGQILRFPFSKYLLKVIC